jgi:hypothetical protein
MNKIAHVFLQIFLSSKERYVFKEQSRIRLTTIYICHIPHTCRHVTKIGREEKHNIIIALSDDPQIPHILRDLRVSYNGISEFYFENLQKLWNNS